MARGHLANHVSRRRSKQPFHVFAKKVNLWLTKILPTLSASSLVKTLFSKNNRLFVCYQLNLGILFK